MKKSILISCIFLMMFCSIYLISCGECKHYFSDYISNNDATYDKDGTKTASCDYGCGETNTIIDEGSILKSYIDLTNFEVNGISLSKFVNNSVSAFNFNKEIKSIGKANFIVAFDIMGTQISETRIVELNEGNNVFYIIEKVEENVKEVYTVNIYRKSLFIIEFEGLSQSQAVEEFGKAIIPQEEPEKEGYSFMGWDFDFNCSISEDKSINAIWHINKYNLTIIYDNGKENEVIPIEYNSEIASLQKPEKQEYVFIGWDKEIPSLMPAEDIVITANWIKGEEIDFAFEMGSIYVENGKEFNSAIRLRSNYILSNNDIYFNNCLNNSVRIYYYDYDKNILWNKVQPIGRNIQHEGYVRLVLFKEDSSIYSNSEIENINQNFALCYKENELPEYWREHLDEKYKIINDRQSDIAENGDSFAFISDVHYEENYSMSPLLLNHLYSNTSIKKLFVGGDLMRGNDDKNRAFSMMNSWMDLISEIPYYYVIGNHDYNTATTNPSDDIIITEQELYDAFIKRNEDNIISNGKPYYYFDNEQQKIRYYVLNTGDGYGENSILTDFDYEKQLMWLFETASALDSSWNIIVVQHIFFYPSTTTIKIDDLGEELISTLDSIHLDRDKPNVFAIISGHVHGDQSILTESGYYCISTATDSMQGGGINNPTKTIGTIAEQAFDVFQFDLKNKAIYATRIGAGEDREWHYQ